MRVAVGADQFRAKLESSHARVSQLNSDADVRQTELKSVTNAKQVGAIKTWRCLLADVNTSIMCFEVSCRFRFTKWSHDVVSLLGHGVS